ATPLLQSTAPSSSKRIPRTSISSSCTSTCPVAWTASRSPHKSASGGRQARSCASQGSTSRNPQVEIYMILDLLELGQTADLNRSEEQFRLLVEGVTDYAIYMLDPSGH